MVDFEQVNVGRVVVTKGVTYLNKPTVKCCRYFQYVCPFLTVQKIKGIFVTLVNAQMSLTIVTNNSILDVLGVLDTALSHALNG